MTARQLADAAGQSDAAAVRFSRAAGYSGYTGRRVTKRYGRGAVQAIYRRDRHQGRGAAGHRGADFQDWAREIITVASPGLVVADLKSLPYQHLRPGLRLPA